MSLYNIENKIKLLLKKKEMAEFKFTSTPTKENRDILYKAIDELEYKLSEYYSEKLFSLKIINEDLFLTYLSINKQTVIRNWLSELIIKWNKL